MVDPVNKSYKTINATFVFRTIKFLRPKIWYAVAWKINFWTNLMCYSFVHSVQWHRAFNDYNTKRISGSAILSISFHSVKKPKPKSLRKSPDLPSKIEKIVKMLCFKNRNLEKKSGKLKKKCCENIVKRSGICCENIVF